MSPAKSLKASLSVPVKPEWDPNSKEPWHLELEKEPVNDNKWNCIVTAAVPSEAQYQEYIQQYHQYISQGIRRAIKTITMDDVIKLVKKPDNGSKRNTKNSKNKKEIIKKSETTIKPPPDSPFAGIIDLATKYATIIDNDCKLPPDLMAGILKYLILKLKKENRLEKKRTILREKKLRERHLRAKFIRDLVLFRTTEKEIPEESKSSDDSIPDDVVQDEPTDGPDLYILLVDFYDYEVFLELRRLGVLFLAVLDISVLGKARTIRESITPALKTDTKRQLIQSFWEKHNSEIKDGGKYISYKDIITIRYIKKIKPYESGPKLFRSLSKELTWTQYSVYVFYRQHQKYLQELFVQRMIVSLEPLSLSKCSIYNKFCDAFVKGGSLTTLLVLYGIVEQVVAGVPETESVAVEYQTQPSDFFYDETDDLDDSKKLMLVTPCLPCRNKKVENICEKIKKNAVKSESLERGGWSSMAEEHNELSLPSQYQNTEEETTIFSPEYLLPESYLDQALSEKQTEKDFRNKKKWEPPVICFFGDYISLETSYFKPRLFNTEMIIERFFKNSNLSRIWDDYPRLPPEYRAFYNFHLQRLKKISQKNEEIIKLQLHFSVLMKMVGVATSFLYKGDEETLSEPEEGGLMVRFSTVQFEKGTNETVADRSDFSSYFIRNFIREEIRTPKAPILKIVSGDVKGSYLGTNKQIQKKAPARSLGPLRNTLSQTSYFQTFESISKSSSDESSSTTEGDRNEGFTLSALLDCYEISSLTQPIFMIKKEDFMSLVENFKFYERFEPHIMIQRLQEAQNEFNTTQSSYFPLTDTFFIIMYDDYDHRGLSYAKTNRILPTPIYFRDFHSYFYDIIAVWLMKEVDEQKKFVQELQNKAKAEAEVSDSLYLSQLNKCYLSLSEEDKQRFLETDLENVEIEIRDEELEELPVKPKPNRPDRVSFVVTNYKDLWVEFTRKMHEFKAVDGTEINVKVESWLYTPSSLLRLRVQILRFELYYDQCLEDEKIETSFTFRTKSGIIFSFYKPEDEEETEKTEEKHYQVTISWPTGLIIQPITLTTSYIKQSYLKVYRKDWDIKEEASRCFVKNGQVIIFNEYGGYEILCPSGTKYTFLNPTAKQKFEITTTTGEVWEVLVSRCKNKKTLLSSMKVFIGEDKKAQEIFYKREDGVYCLLWTNGKLVTSYPDGTKITSTPDFDENEITVDWTDEEKFWLKELRMNNKSELSTEKSTNRSSVKHKISFSDRKSYENDLDESFVSISCSYLIEHPKYASVYYDTEEDNIRLTMPDNINMYVYPGGEYTIRRENTSLKVTDTIIEARKECPECRVKTTVELFLFENEILCKCVDVNHNLFLLYRNGKTTYEENQEVSEDKPNISTIRRCIAHHNKSEILKQRCFALERDLSGVEFLHADSIAMYADKLSEDTFYDINTEDPSNMCHTFTCPYYKVGSEKWTMKYETEDDSLPTNLKKKDLKELGVKEVVKNFFKYPFPGKKGCGGDQEESKPPKKNVEMPKLVVARTIWAWPQDPYSVIEEFKEDIENYQEEGRFIRNRYRTRVAKNEQSYDARYIMMRLRKIALTLNQSLQMYPHLCTQYPSTEKEIHYFGHFINTMGDMKSHFKYVDIIPDCKQIPIPLPRKADFPPISEESGSPRSD